MVGGGWRIGSVAGIEIRIDPSWAIVAFVFAYFFFGGFVTTFEGISTGLGIALAAVTTLVFFGSVLVHELAHSLVALTRGISVHSITLFLFGGVTRSRLDTEEPADEFLIAGVGPLTSAVLGAVFWGAAALSEGVLPETWVGMFSTLAILNLALAVFNLVPGFPLDGGRLLRSAVWHFTGDLTRATRIASTGGELIGFALIGWGVLRVLAADLVGGLWTAAIGWFLTQAARSSRIQLQVRMMLSDATAGELMGPDPVRIPSDITVQEAIDRYFMRYDHNAFPVGDDTDTVGLLTMPAVRRMTPEERAQRTAGEAAEPFGDGYVVGVDTPMDRVVECLEDEDVKRAVVVDDDRVVGIVSPRDVSRWLRRSMELRDDGEQRVLQPLGLPEE